MKVFKVISEEYGAEALKMARNYERFAGKLADLHNNRVFNLRCLHSRVHPKFVRLHTVIPGMRAQGIIQRAERALLNESVRLAVHRIRITREKMAECEEWLLAHLDGRHFDALVECNAAAHRKRKSDVACKQRSKFDRLLQSAARGECMDGITLYKGSGLENPGGRSVTNLLPEEICKRWVTDLTSRKLGRAEMSVLTRGLNFSVTPKEVPVAEIVTHVESCLTSAKLEPDVADAVRAMISASLMKKRELNLNITGEEYSALDALRKDKEIVVLPADKGRSTVVLNKVDYDKKVMTLLEDRDTYEVITKDPTSKIRTRSCGLLRGLRSEGVLSKEQYFSI